MDERIYPQLHEIERTHWWFTGRRKVIRAALTRIAAPRGRVLDVGCGAGANLDLLGDWDPTSRIHGIDLERTALRFCRADRATPVAQADMMHLPFCAGSFDLILALDAIEHVSDDEAVLRELFRVCRPGGAVLLTVPAFPFLWGSVDDIGHHFRRYRRADLLEKLENAGLLPQMVHYFNTLLFPPIALVRLLGRILPRRHLSPDDEFRSDFDLVKSGPLNALLARVFALESHLLAVPFPFGVSLLCVAHRPERSAARRSNDGRLA